MISSGCRPLAWRRRHTTYKALLLLVLATLAGKPCAPRRQTFCSLRVPGETALSQQDLEGLTLRDLQGELRSRGLPVSGRKAALVERLLGANGYHAQFDKAEVGEDLSVLAIPELKYRLRRRGLPMSGRKATLVGRLQGMALENNDKVQQQEEEVDEAEGRHEKEAIEDAEEDGAEVLHALPVVALKDRLRERGMPVSGRKAELIERLQGVIAEKNGRLRIPPEGDEAEDEAEEDLHTLPVAVLKERLKKRGLYVSGRKAELVERLQAADLPPAPPRARRRVPTIAPLGPVLNEPDFPADRFHEQIAAEEGLRLVPGDLVRAWSKDAGWRRATVTSVNSDGSYRVVWEVDDSTGQCSPDKIRKLKPGGFPVTDLSLGVRLLGEVTSVQSYGVFVDVGAERDGLVPKSKLSDATFENIRDVVNVGDQVEVWVTRIRPDGALELTAVNSKVPLPSLPEHRIQALEVGQRLEGTVKRVMEYGAFVDVGAERDGLVPRAKIFTARVTDAREAVEVGQHVVVWVSRVWDQYAFELTMVEGEPSVAEQRVVERPSRTLEVGQKLSGVVRKEMPYGVFVDIGSERDGLVPFARMPAGATALNPGQQIDVWIRRVRPDGSIELVTDREGPDAVQLEVGGQLRGKVTRIAEFGIFVDVNVDRDGLVPLEYIAEEKVTSVDVWRAFEVGQEVDVWVSRIKDDGAIELAMVCRRICDLHVGQKLRGTITGLTEQGTFVSVGAERPGLVLPSKMAEQAVTVDNMSEFAQVGQSVDVWVSRIRGNLLELSMVESKIWRDGRDISAFLDVPPSQWLDGVIRSVTVHGVFVGVTPPCGSAPQDGLVTRDLVHPTASLLIGAPTRVRLLRVDQGMDRLFLTMLE